MAKKIYSYDEIMDSLKRKAYKPVYMLMGEEAYFIDQISDYIEDHVLTEDEKAFNLTVLYGKETTIQQVIGAAKRYPMMAPYQVIIVKESQAMGSYDDLVYYLQQPQPTTILVFCHKHGTVDKRKKVNLEIEKAGLIFESKLLYENEIPTWIGKYVASKQTQIEAKAAQMLADFIGSDLCRIANEIDKLLIIKPAGEKAITCDLIEKNIGISKSYNNFELTKALGMKDVLKANRIINYFANNPKNNPSVVTITVLFNYFYSILLYHTLSDKSQMSVASELKVNPYFVKDYVAAAKHYNARKCVKIISDIRDADVRSKGFGDTLTDDGNLMRELIYKILH